MKRKGIKGKGWEDVKFVDAVGLLAMGGKKITTHGREMVVLKDGKRKGLGKDFVALYLPSKAAQALGSKGGKARAANLTKERISEIGRQGARARWELKDADGVVVTDAEVRERVKRYLRKNPNSNAHDLMPVQRGPITPKNPEGIESNPLNLITPYSRVRFVAQMRRIQKALAELNRRGEIAEVNDPKERNPYNEFPRYVVITKAERRQIEKASR